MSLADVYAVITYYLRHRSEVEEYLELRAREHAELRQEIEDRSEYQELRERLLGRIRKAWLEENREAIEAYNEHVKQYGVFSTGLRGF